MKDWTRTDIGASIGASRSADQFFIPAVPRGRLGGGATSSKRRPSALVFHSGVTGAGLVFISGVVGAMECAAAAEDDDADEDDMAAIVATPFHYSQVLEWNRKYECISRRVKQLSRFHV